jgi:hypothetical protein
MIVRIKLKPGPAISNQRNLDSKLALAVASLLTPAAVLSLVVALWRVLADAKIAEEFAIEQGLMSHWQVWLALGILLQSLSVYLDRYGRRIERQS